MITGHSLFAKEDEEEPMKCLALVGASVLLILGLAQPLAGLNGASQEVAKQPQERPSSFFTFSGFSVAVTLSDKAMEKLKASKETVIVAGYVAGDPKKGALKKYIDSIGQVDLTVVKAEVNPGEIARITEIKVKQNLLDQIDRNATQLLINVYSGRKSSENNLLDCGIYEGPLKAIPSDPIAISCKLIGE